MILGCLAFQARRSCPGEGHVSTVRNIGDRAKPAVALSTTAWTSEVPQIVASIPKREGIWAVILGTLDVQVHTTRCSSVASPDVTYLIERLFG